MKFKPSIRCMPKHKNQTRLSSKEGGGQESRGAVRIERGRGEGWGGNATDRNSNECMSWTSANGNARAAKATNTYTHESIMAKNFDICTLIVSLRLGKSLLKSKELKETEELLERNAN